MVTPGPDVLFVLGRGTRGGPRAGLLATAGVATSGAVHMAVAYTAVRVAGAGYLMLIRRRGSGHGDPSVPVRLAVER